MLGLMAYPTASFAGAWTLDAGQSIAIVTGTLTQSDKAFDGSGNTQPIARYSKNELQALFEFGATNWLTLMLAPSCSMSTSPRRSKPSVTAWLHRPGCKNAPRRR